MSRKNSREPVSMLLGQKYLFKKPIHEATMVIYIFLYFYDISIQERKAVHTFLPNRQVVHLFTCYCPVYYKKCNCWRLAGFIQTLSISFGDKQTYRRRNNNLSYD